MAPPGEETTDMLMYKTSIKMNTDDFRKDQHLHPSSVINSRFKQLIL